MLNPSASIIGVRDGKRYLLSTMTGCHSRIGMYGETLGRNPLDEIEIIFTSSFPWIEENDKLDKLKEFTKRFNEDYGKTISIGYKHIPRAKIALPNIVSEYSVMKGIKGILWRNLPPNVKNALLKEGYLNYVGNHDKFIKFIRNSISPKTHKFSHLKFRTQVRKITGYEIDKDELSFIKHNVKRMIDNTDYITMLGYPEYKNGLYNDGSTVFGFDDSKLVMTLHMDNMPKYGGAILYLYEQFRALLKYQDFFNETMEMADKRPKLKMWDAMMAAAAKTSRSGMSQYYESYWFEHDRDGGNKFTPIISYTDLMKAPFDNYNLASNSFIYGMWANIKDVANMKVPIEESEFYEPEGGEYRVMGNSRLKTVKSGRVYTFYKNKNGKFIGMGNFRVEESRPILKKWLIKV